MMQADDGHITIPAARDARHEDVQPSRRGLLAGAAAALGAVGPPAAIRAQANPDAWLLALIAEFHANDKASADLLDPLESLPRTDPRKVAAWEHHYDVLLPRWHELKWQIAATPARTREGLMEKARCAQMFLFPDVNGVPDDDDAIPLSVLHDVLGLPPIKRPEA